MMRLMECLEAKEGIEAQFAGVYILKWQQEWGPPEYLFREVDSPLYDAAPALLAACKMLLDAVKEMPELGYNPDWKSPNDVLQNAMDSSHAAIALAEDAP